MTTDPTPLDDAALVRLFRDACTDWDGTQMKDAEEPRITPSCGYLRAAADYIEAHRAPAELSPEVKALVEYARGKHPASECNATAGEIMELANYRAPAEPVAWIDPKKLDGKPRQTTAVTYPVMNWTPLYAAPPTASGEKEK